MATGRKPKPTTLKVIEGNKGKRPLNKGEPKPKSARKPKAPPPGKGGENKAEDKLPNPPDWLDRLAKLKWRKLAGELDRLGLLTVVDLDMFAAYCDAYSVYRRMKKIIRDNGETFTNDNGEIKRRPETTIAKEAMMQMRALAAEFGLTPSSRSRIDFSQKEESDAKDFLQNTKRAT